MPDPPRPDGIATPRPSAPPCGRPRGAPAPRPSHTRPVPSPRMPDPLRPNELATPPPSDPMVRRAVTLARWLDERWLDPLIGLVVPEAGDLMTAGVGLYIVAAGIHKGLPAVVIARMLLNLGIDVAIGAVPVLGDLLDFAYKAN